MILVRDVFQVKFGRMKEAVEAWKEMEKVSPMPAENHYRMLTDLTGQYYTLVLEGTFKDLADYEKFLKKEMAGAENRTRVLRGHEQLRSRDGRGKSV